MPVASYTLQYHNGASWQTIAASSVLSVSGSATLDDNPAGIAFGSDTDTGMGADLLLSLWASLPYLTPVRFQTTMDATTNTIFTGFVTERTRNLERMTIQCSGPKVKIANTKGYSPMIERRPVATLTTASSIENPATAGYQAGLINWLLWTAGGRPLQQAGTYTSATFYYSVDGTALLAPRYAWAAGEDAWQECVNLARAGGGQMTQDGAGVIRYVNVLGYGGLSATETLDESDYATLDEDESPSALYGTKYTAQYLPRRRLARQEIINDDTPRQIDAGETETIILEPEYPITGIDRTAAGLLKPGALTITNRDATAATTYTHTVDVKAARITITIENTGTTPLMLWRIRLNGDPVVAGEAGSISVGSGSVEKVLEQSPYIQSRDDAERLAGMMRDFYSVERSRVSVRGAVHNPARALGQAINLTNAQWGLSAIKHVILEWTHDQTGAEDGFVCAPVADLPTAADYYRIGGTYTDASEKKLGW